MDEVSRDKYAHNIFLGICFCSTRPYVLQYEGELIRP